MKSRDLWNKLAEMRDEGAPAWDTLLDPDQGATAGGPDYDVALGWEAALDELEAWLKELSA